MSEEPKDVRLPFMVTASEAKAIDEWRYANRVPSRAEAMRMLIHRGLGFDILAREASTIAKEIIKLLDQSESDQDLKTLSDASKQQMKIITSLLEMEFGELNLEVKLMREVFEEMKSGEIPLKNK